MKIKSFFVLIILIAAVLVSGENLALAGNLDIPTGFGLPDPAGGIKEILTNLLNWLLGIIGAVALISFAISGLQYFMAAGNEKSAETAKRNITYSILGIIAALSGLVIVQAVDWALNAFSFF